MHSYFNLAENPLFVKHVRSRMRRAQVLPALFLVCFVSLAIVFIETRVAQGDQGIGSHLFFWLQSFILLLIGGSQVASAVAYVKESGILDFHRVTPVPARVQVLGFLLGAPIREWMLFACTLPFAFYLAVTGPWGLVGFTKVLVVQITGALLYHAVGVVTGLAGKSARAASGRLVGIVVALNVASSNLNEAGIYGPALLSPLPVYREVAFEKMPAFQQAAAIRNQRRFGNNAAQQAPGDPHFFAVSMPLVVQTLLFQGSIFAFLVMAATRRFRSNRLPLYTKPQALAFLGTLAVLTLGSLWETSPVVLNLATAYFLMFASLWLISAVSPMLGDFMKALQRARRDGRPVPDWADLASNRVVVLGFALVVLVSLGFAQAAGPVAPGRGVKFEPWGPLVVSVLAILSFGWSLQYFYLRYDRRGPPYFTVFFLTFWVVPLVVGALAAASGASDLRVLMAPSPIAGIAMSSGVDMMRDVVVVQIASIAPSAILTLLFGGLLVSEERRRVTQVQREYDARQAEAATAVEPGSRRASSETGLLEQRY